MRVDELLVMPLFGQSQHRLAQVQGFAERLIAGRADHGRTSGQVLGKRPLAQAAEAGRSIRGLFIAPGAGGKAIDADFAARGLQQL